MATGITKRHSRRCRSRDGGRCNCDPTYEAWVYSKRDSKKISKKFTREAEAKSWRGDAVSALSKGALRAPKRTTIREAWGEWTRAPRPARSATARDSFKPSALRAYRIVMRIRVLPALGAMRLDELRRSDLQEFADGLLVEGLSASYIQTTLLPVRAIVRRAMARDELVANPCAGLHLPAVRGRRERYASPDEAEALVAAVPVDDRATWATAMYGGLRDYLLEHLARDERQGADLIFGRTPSLPFAANRLQERADEAWKDAGLERLTPHACRHTFASLMIAASVNAKALSTFMGHATIAITLDRYGHLMPGSEEEAAGLLDTYLDVQRERAEEAARGASGVLTGAQTGAQLGRGD